MSSSYTSSSAFQFSSATSRQRAQLRISSCASLHFMSSTFVSLLPFPFFLNADTGVKTSSSELYFGSSPLRLYLSLQWMVFTGHIRSTATRMLNDIRPYPSVHTTYRFWTDILLMLSAIGQVISSVITVMVRLVVFARYILLIPSKDILPTIGDEGKRVPPPHGFQRSRDSVTQCVRVSGANSSGNTHGTTH